MTSESATQTRISAAHRLDPTLVRRNFERCAATYDRAAILNSRVRDELLGRLDWLKLDARDVLDAGVGTGKALVPLQRRFRRARLTGVDIAPAMLTRAAGNKPRFRRARLACADIAALPFPDASFDLVFSNLVVHWSNDLDGVFREFRRVLRPRGALLLSTFGPDTLGELRCAWAGVDCYSHVNAFADMHDLGDGLLRAGLAEPVLDVERFTLTYTDARGLMRDLQATGARNATAGRARGLMGASRLRAVESAYEEYRVDGRLPATHEVVFAQAWAPSPVSSAGETRVPLTAIGRRGGPR